MTSELLDRTPPHSPEAEQAVLGAILLDAKVFSRVVDIIGPSDFYAEDHGRIFAHYAALHNGGDGVIDPMLVKSRMQAAGENTVTLVEIAAAGAVAANAEHYAHVVAGHAARRRTIQVGTAMVDAAYNNGEPTRAIVMRAKSDLDAIGDRLHREDRFPLRSAIDVMQSDETITYIIPGILADRQPAILVLLRYIDVVPDWETA